MFFVINLISFIITPYLWGITFYIESRQQLFHGGTVGATIKFRQYTVLQKTFDLLYNTYTYLIYNCATVINFAVEKGRDGHRNSGKIVTKNKLFLLVGYLWRNLSEYTYRVDLTKLHYVFVVLTVTLSSL